MAEKGTDMKKIEERKRSSNIQRWRKRRGSGRGHL
jgi:hypothetical protein